MHYLISYDIATGTIGEMHGSSILEELPEIAGDTTLDGALYIESDGTPDIQNKVVRNGVLVVRDRSIEDVRREARQRLDRLVSSARVTYIPKTRGASHMHLKKQLEAERYLALPSRPNDLSDFPLLEAEIGVSAGSAEEVARLWIDKAKETDAALARIERARMEAKAAIWKAGSEAEIEKVLKGFEGA